MASLVKRDAPEPSQRKKRPIKDWALKLELIKFIFDVPYRTSIIDIVLPKDEEADFNSAVREAYKKWHEKRPEAEHHLEYLRRLGVRVGCAPDIRAIQIIDSTIDEFVEMLPDAERDPARKIVAKLKESEKDEPFLRDVVPQEMAVFEPPADMSPEEWEELHSIFFSLHEVAETVREGFDKGRIDQRLLYTSLESVRHWDNLIDALEYPTFEHCRNSLKSLMQTPEWRRYLDAHPIDSVVMLGGGGATSKDKVVISAMLAQKTPIEQLQYVILDISPYMLMASYKNMFHWLRQKGWRGRVRLRPLNLDFMSLRGDRHDFRGKAGNLWCITAGTIGNVDEGRFLQSVNSRAQKGDVLVIAADTRDTKETLDVFKTEVTAKYKNGPMMEFVAPPLRTLLADLREPISFAQALERVEIDVVPAVEHGYGVVPDSWAVEISIEMRGKEVVLLTSTRYEQPSLLAFAQSYGWEHVTTAPCASNPDFAQFMFVKK